jgi:cytochrome P450
MNPDIEKRLLLEILPHVEKAKENIIENLQYETVMEFDYLQRCFYEALRIEPPVPSSFAATMNAAVTINGIPFRKD